MKKFRLALVALNSFLALCLIATLLLPVSCVKEKMSKIDDTDLLDDHVEPDWERLAAFFDGLQGILYVDPDYLLETLQSMGADLVDLNNALAVLLSHDGQWRLTHFVVEPVTAAELVATTKSGIQRMNEAIEHSRDAIAERPVNSMSYRGKSCALQPERFGMCHVIGQESSVTYRYPMKKCVQASDMRNVCTEFHTEGLAENRTYKNRSCTGEYTAKTLHDWACRN
ncbi:MAG: hypothetical protein ACK4NS_01160 [Saprospiraceae bacterium]